MGYNDDMKDYKSELDKVTTQYKIFRDLSFNEILTLREIKNQSINNKEKIEKITKYAESLKNDYFLIYLSLMEILETK